MTPECKHTVLIRFTFASYARGRAGFPLFFLPTLSLLLPSPLPAPSSTLRLLGHPHTCASMSTPAHTPTPAHVPIPGPGALCWGGQDGHSSNSHPRHASQHRTHLPPVLRETLHFGAFHPQNPAGWPAPRGHGSAGRGRGGSAGLKHRSPHSRVLHLPPRAPEGVRPQSPRSSAHICLPLPVRPHLSPTHTHTRRWAVGTGPPRCGGR